MGTQHPCLVREECQLLEPVLILAVVLVTGKVESLDVTDEGIGGPDSGIEAPGIVNGVDRRPGAVVEILHLSRCIAVFGIIAGRIAHCSGHGTEILRHIGIHVRQHTLSRIEVSVHILLGLQAAGLVEIEDIAGNDSQRQEHCRENSFHIHLVHISLTLKVELDSGVV